MRVVLHPVASLLWLHLCPFHLNFNNKEKAKMRVKILEEQGKGEFDSEEGIVTNKTLKEQEQIKVYVDEVRKAFSTGT